MPGLTKLDAVNEMLEVIPIWPVAALDTDGSSDAAEAERILDRECERIQARGWPENTEDNIELKPYDVTIVVTGGTGTFLEGETVSEASSGATGRFHKFITTAGTQYMPLTTLTGTFTGGETLTGATSGATKTGGNKSSESEGQIAVDYDILSVKSGRDITLRGGWLYDRNRNSWAYKDPVIITQIRNLAFIDLPTETRDAIVAEAKQIFQRHMIGSETKDGFLSQERNLAEVRAIPKRPGDAATHQVQVIQPAASPQDNQGS